VWWQSLLTVRLPNCRVAMTDHPGSPDRPESFELVDRYLGAAKIAHEFAFNRHRQLVELDAADDHTRTLLAESAAIALQDIPALVRSWHALEREWFEVELLDPAKLDDKTQALTVRFGELDPALHALRVRQDAIVAQLVDLLDNARRT
jgi:hypothetical protein